MESDASEQSGRWEGIQLEGQQHFLDWSSRWLRFCERYPLIGIFGGILTGSQVVGEVGIKLNYDELVVYNNDAIRPSYLVMYDIPK